MYAEVVLFLRLRDICSDLHVDPVTIVNVKVAVPTVDRNAVFGEVPLACRPLPCSSRLTAAWFTRLGFVRHWLTAPAASDGYAAVGGEPSVSGGHNEGKEQESGVPARDVLVEGGRAQAHALFFK